jgi:formyl-CoA transferase
MPLSDLLVLDLTRARAGPTSARQLADWGANVIYIEEPADQAGDGMGGARDGFDFQNLHRNKRSITINLKEEKGKEIFFELARRADVITENYRPDVKRRLGIDYDAVKAINPRIIYGSISGFGQSGPYRDRPGYDQIAQGMGGLMSVTGLPGQGPVRVGIPIADLTAGIFLAMGILVALHQRERTGVGQWVHTSLLEAQISMLDFQASRWLIGHEVPPQAGNDHPTGVPTGVFPTADGTMNIAASGDSMFRRLCNALGIPDLPEDERFKQPRIRSKNRVELNAALAERTRLQPTAYWIEKLNEASVPCGPIYTIDQTMNDPQVKHLGMARPVKHPRLGDLEVVGQPVNLEGVGGKPAVRLPSPDLGQHSSEILEWLGYDAGAIDRLKQEHVI